VHVTDAVEVEFNVQPDTR